MLSWRKAPNNNGFLATRHDGGEYHVYRAEKGRRVHDATLNGEVIGRWSDAADAMADIARSDILRRLRPYVSAHDVEITDVAVLARMIADRAVED